MKAESGNGKWKWWSKELVTIYSTEGALVLAVLDNFVCNTSETVLLEHQTDYKLKISLSLSMITRALVPYLKKREQTMKLQAARAGRDLKINVM